MKSLITGGAGFVGAAVAKILIEKNHEVVILDDFSRGNYSRLERIKDNVKIVPGDVRDDKKVDNLTAGCDFVWHFAYINGTKNFYSKPDEILEVGVKGSINTLESSIKHNVGRYIVASSSEVYNAPTILPTPETERITIPDITNPRFSYSGGKILAELLTIHYGTKRNLDTIIVRPHNIYGPNMGFGHVVPEIFKKIFEESDGLNKKEISIEIQGTGHETRSFCFIDDLAMGTVMAGIEGNSGEIYNVGTENEITILELIEEMSNILNIKINIVPGKITKGSPSRRCPDMTKLSSIGFLPKVSLKKGLKHTLSWYENFLRDKSE